jgi:hypothetical protein
VTSRSKRLEGHLQSLFLVALWLKEAARLVGRVAINATNEFVWARYIALATARVVGAPPSKDATSPRERATIFVEWAARTVAHVTDPLPVESKLDSEGRIVIFKELAGEAALAALIRVAAISSILMRCESGAQPRVLTRQVGRSTSAVTAGRNGSNST